MMAERITDYLLSLEPDESPLLEEIRGKAEEREIPIIRRETGALLRTLIAAIQPRAILEVGTAVGYSAILMAEAAPEGCSVTTIEKYGPRIAEAREYLARAGLEGRAELLEGDASEILKSLAGPYDFIFMDAAKGQYMGWLPELMRLLACGGMLVSDNVLQDGTILESRFAVERRDRTIHARMREYLWTIKHTEELQTAIVPVGDGVAVSVRKYAGGRATGGSRDRRRDAEVRRDAETRRDAEARRDAETRRDAEVRRI